MANVQLPSVNTAEQDNGKLLKQLLNAYIMLTEELTHLLNNLDTRNINYLSADVIDAGTLNAALVKIQTALMNGGFITLDAEGMKINNGYMDTFKVGLDGKPIMTGASVQSATGYPKVVMDPDSQLFGAYTSETEAVTIGPYKTGVSSSPYVRWESAGKGHQMNILGNQLLMSGFLEVAIAAGLGRNVVIQGDRIKLHPEQTVDVDSWSKIRNTSTGQTLDQFATKGVYTESSQSYNCGIPIGTQFKDVNGMTWTWGGVPAHSHKQV